MSEALFLRLLTFEDKAEALAEAVAATREGNALNLVAHVVDPSSFEQIPGSTFAYWVGERVLRVFKEFSAFEDDNRAAKKGVSTGDDFRFVRTWWEVEPERALTGSSITTQTEFRQQTMKGKSWVPFAKGGAYSPYYSDLHLVLNWHHDGAEIRNFPNAFIRNESFYFRPGLTWSDRTTSNITFRTFPAGAIFAAKGPVAFAPNQGAWLPLLQSSIYGALISLQLGAADAAARSYEVGIIQRSPVPDPTGNDKFKLLELGSRAVDIKRSLDTGNESSHIFRLPPLLQFSDGTLTERAAAWQQRISETEGKLAEYQCEIDDIAFRLYGIDGADREAIEETLVSGQASTDNEEVETESAEETEAEQPTADHRQLTVDLLSYFIGCAFGRWDVHYATGERSAPELPDPFAPLPVCAPGALTGADSLPLRKSPPDYPLRVVWDGIVVDDPSHNDDIIRRVRDVFELIWQKRAEQIEREACELLGVKTLRDYFRRPAAGGFWTDHVRRYSKSRRKAPIYWLLQSSKKSYAIWLYYHRLDKDILYKVLLNYVEPKIRLEESALSQVRAGRTEVGTAGKAAKQLEKQLERQESLLSELYDFRDKLQRAANLNLEPDLNDGVVLNIAPLWELVPWPEAKKYWEELKRGKYEWSAISRQLRGQGVVHT